MKLNYTALILISLIPILIAYFWYHPNSPILKWSGEDTKNSFKKSPQKLFLFFLFSLIMVYGLMNLTMYQIGFYELFFTDIMKGSPGAQKFMSNFFGKNGGFFNGVFHGTIGAFLFMLPVIGVQAILSDKSKKYVGLHFFYWLVTSMLVSGLIASFV